MLVHKNHASAQKPCQCTMHALAWFLCNTKHFSCWWSFRWNRLYNWNAKVKLVLHLYTSVISSYSWALSVIAGYHNHPLTGILGFIRLRTVYCLKKDYCKRTILHLGIILFITIYCRGSTILRDYTANEVYIAKDYITLLDQLYY